MEMEMGIWSELSGLCEEKTHESDWLRFELARMFCRRRTLGRICERVASKSCIAKVLHCETSESSASGTLRSRAANLLDFTVRNPASLALRNRRIFRQKLLSEQPAKQTLDDS